MSFHGENVSLIETIHMFVTRVCFTNDDGPSVQLTAHRPMLLAMVRCQIRWSVAISDQHPKVQIVDELGRSQKVGLVPKVTRPFIGICKP